jgi:hypothetical protein
LPFTTTAGFLDVQHLTRIHRRSASVIVSRGGRVSAGLTRRLIDYARLRPWGRA